jgi:hypothetical protein
MIKMTGKYWEDETPVIVNTGKNVLRLFKGAGKLQVSAASWKDKEGNEKPGKTVTLDLEAFKATPEAREILQALQSS